MFENYTNNITGDDTNIPATETTMPEKSLLGDALNPPLKGVEEDSVPTVAERLRPTCPNPDKGFQPLSDYLVDRITKATMKRMKRLAHERHIPLDFEYWENITRTILGQPSTDTIIVCPAPAGSGKSTWILSFLLAIKEFFSSDPELAASIVGVVVILQKVEDINQLAAALNADSTKDNPSMVALQGWSSSGQKNGFCRNPGVNCFDECKPGSCTHAQSCEILKFRRQALRALIVGLTQERFEMLRESDNLDSVLCRLDENDRPRHRRYIIFDEKFQMAQISTLDKDCIDQASMEFSGLIEKVSATDFRVRSLQQSLAYHIDRTFQDLRRSLCSETEHGLRDIQAGFCNLPPGYMDLQRDISFQIFSDFVLHQRKQYATKHLRTALTVMESLYNGQRHLFSKVNGFAITHIAGPPPQYGESQSIIFDATAEVDEDYRCLQNARFSKGVPSRKKRSLIFHVYTNGDLNVSKSAMSKSWKIPAMSQFIAELAEDTDGDIFLCSYKDHAEALAQELRKTMSAKTFRRILLMPDRESTVPYFGGTNGSNAFRSATTVFALGYPRLNPRDYLIRACAAYGEEQIKRDLAGVEPEALTSNRADFIWALPSVKIYMAHHLAARLEQEICRCKHRMPDFEGETNVYFFCPPSDMMEILRNRLNPDNTYYYTELPACVDKCKRSARRYEGDLTSYGRLTQFLMDWDGTKISVQDLRAKLGISTSVWKDLMGDERVKGLLEQHQIQREGRGPNAAWYKAIQALSA